MHRTFSLATLLMVMAIVAVAMASIRLPFARIGHGASSIIVLPMIAGSVGGAAFGVALAIWRRAAWGWTIAGIVGGLGLGAAAGAQATAPVAWPVVVLGPLVVIGSAGVVALARQGVVAGRRQAKSVSADETR